jgi:cytochrome c oxidase subunit I+III
VTCIVATYARRPNTAYTLVAVSMAAIGFFSFGLWVHHMFTTGLPNLSLSFFAAASMSIAIPSGVQIFSWIATLWGTRPKLETPFLFVLGFFFIFVLGGITGVMLAAIPFNDQVHDTFFVVAHFHYVLIGGAVFPLFAGIHYWYPKVVGRMMSEYWGRISFVALFIGFNATFFPMHVAGMMGMPRQVYTYRSGLGWETANMIATLGSILFAAGVGVLLLNAAISKRRGVPAPDNPWGSGTLEWATSSPPASYNFEHIPYVERRYPLWPSDDHGPADPDLVLPTIDEDELGMKTTQREAVVTGVMDGQLQHRVIVASPLIWPLFAALSVAVIFLGIMISLWFVPIGVTLTYIAFVGWLWPRKEEFELQ